MDALAYVYYGVFVQETDIEKARTKKGYEDRYDFVEYLNGLGLRAEYAGNGLILAVPGTYWCGESPRVVRFDPPQIDAFVWNQRILGICKQLGVQDMRPGWYFLSAVSP